MISKRARSVNASGIRKVFDLAAKIKNPINLSIGQPLRLEGKLKQLVDRYGQLKKGDAYSVSKSDGGVEITFKDEMLAGVDVLAVMEE